MVRRTVDYLIGELKRLAKADPASEVLIQKGYEALQAFRALRETDSALSQSEWIGLLLSARDLLPAADPTSPLAQSVLDLEIQTILNGPLPASTTGSIETDFVV